MERGHSLYNHQIEIEINYPPPQTEPEPPLPIEIDEESSRNGPRVYVSMFDDSVENHFRVMRTISEICGEAEPPLSENDIQRLSSSTTFLRNGRILYMNLEMFDLLAKPKMVRGIM